MIKNYSLFVMFLIPLVLLSGCVGTYQPYFPEDGGGTQPICTPRSESRCEGDCIFWYDSCGNREEIKECCTHGCVNGQCAETNPCEESGGYCESSIAEVLCAEGFEESELSCYSDAKFCCAPAGCPGGECILENEAEQLVTSYDSRQTEPSIYGNLIAYVDDKIDPDGDIYVYDISKGEEEPLIEKGGFQYDPVVCGKYLVYGEKEGNGLYIYDMDEKKSETIFQKDQENQDCSDKYVVWRERKTDKILYLYDIPGKTTDEIRNTMDLDTNNEIVSPSTDGNYVVWGEVNFNLKDIYLYNITGNVTTRISENTTPDSWPDISGNRIVWIRGEPGMMDLVVYDILSKTKQSLGLSDFGMINQPRINGNMVAWTGCRSDKYRDHYSESGFTITLSCIDFDVYAYNLDKKELYIVETSDEEQRHAEAYGNRIVWHGWDRRKNTKPKIYMKEI